MLRDRSGGLVVFTGQPGLVANCLLAVVLFSIPYTSDSAACAVRYCVCRGHGPEPVTLGRWSHQPVSMRRIFLRRSLGHNRLAQRLHSGRRTLT